MGSIFQEVDAKKEGIKNPYLLRQGFVEQGIYGLENLVLISFLEKGVEPTPIYDLDELGLNLPSREGTLIFLSCLVFLKGEQLF